MVLEINYLSYSDHQLRMQNVERNAWGVERKCFPRPTPDALRSTYLDVQQYLNEDPMGEREIFLLLGAMLFFTMTTMSINRFCLNNSQVIMESEFNYYAISLAQKYIEEAKTKAFGDLNGYYDTMPADINGPKVNYNIQVQVGYVTVDDLNTILLTPPPDPYYKKMIVTVTSDFLSTPVVLSHVFSYFEY